MHVRSCKGVVSTLTCEINDDQGYNCMSYSLSWRDVYKKSLKIPKWQSESVYRIRTDNTMAKRKSTKGQTTINKTYI